MSICGVIDISIRDACTQRVLQDESMTGGKFIAGNVHVSAHG